MKQRLLWLRIYLKDSKGTIPSYSQTQPRPIDANVTHLSLPSERRLLVGVCGIPASGKTTLALNIVKKLNLSEDGIAVCVGLDGWHFRYLLDRIQTLSSETINLFRLEL